MTEASYLDELFGVRGKSVLVTGGSRGIGRMMAEGFVRAGATVCITARKAEACDATAAELSKLGECFSLPSDVSTEEGCARLASELTARLPSLDVLVNNAGATWGAPLESFPDSALDKLWGVNVKGPFHLTRLLLPQLRTAASKDDPARVIMVGSVDGLAVPRTESYAYSATKAALHMLTRHLARALADDHVTVNAIAPGLFHSKMTGFAFDAVGEAALSEGIPLHRVGRPGDMAGAALYLASNAGSYVTGSLLVVDGGLVGTAAAAEGLDG
jgi:NAD(P)-dependent dehydrogenase (short-subunit alcohol dehydrogenase family)